MGLSNYLPSSRISQAGVCTSSTRPASPYDGQVIYETDTDRTLVWNNSAWVFLSTSTANPVGLEFIATATANGTNRALVVDNVFSSAYTNYKVIVHLRCASNTNNLFYQYLNNSGTTIAADYFGTAYAQDYTSGSTTWVPSPLTLTTVQYVGYIPNSTFHYIDASMDIFSPFVAADGTSVVGQFSGLSSGAAFAGGQILGKMNGAGQYRGLRFDNGGASNITGTVTVYGYKG